MKKNIFRITCACMILLVNGFAVIAQAPPQPPTPAADNYREIRDTADEKEIVIRQKNEKDTKITIEIKSGEYFINGKPLETFTDDNIAVEKRNTDDMNFSIPGTAYSPSPFRTNPWSENRMWKERQMEEIKKKMEKMKRMDEVYLGVSSKADDKNGSAVLEVSKGSPAEKAGIKPGDVISKVNETIISNPAVLYETIHKFKAGDKVKISFLRSGKLQTVVAALEKEETANKNFNYNYHFKMPPFPPMPDMGDFDMKGWPHPGPKLGVRAQDTEDGKGVQIVSVEDSSVAAKSGLKKGDIILSFDGAETSGTNELIGQLEEASHKTLVKIKISRDGAIRDLEIRFPKKLNTAEL